MDGRARYAKERTARMIGMKFNALTVVSHHSRDRGYNCRCDCGSAIIAKTHALKTGRQKSCGCIPRKTKPEHYAAKNSVYRGYRGAARRRGYDFELSRAEFFWFLDKPCVYCRAMPSSKVYLPRHREFRYNGVDRINNDQGYVEGNCVACCDKCNTSKAELSLDEWSKWIVNLYTNLISRGRHAE